jgi:NAD(P)-dependent dehydrogenase (short-subunit alcohol dehydrogenase family)
MTLSELFDLRGKVALVTGGARDLGLDMAGILAEAGCDLVITSRKLVSAQKAAARLKRLCHRETLPLALDVKNPSDIKEVVRQAAQFKGRIDILINNAGGGIPGSGANLFERTPAEILELVSTNLLGTLFCCREVGALMAKQKGGKIINIASIAALVGRDRRVYERCQMRGQPVDYAAAKSGIVGLTRDLAALLGPKGVYVNCISPGGFARGNVPPKFIKEYSDRTPLGRMGRDGADLKGAALFLASPASDYVTGQNLVVDGGFTIWK